MIISILDTTDRFWIWILGNTFDAQGKSTGFRTNNQTTGWRDQHGDPNSIMVESPDEDMDASIMHNLRNKRSAAQKKRAKGQSKQQK